MHQGVPLTGPVQAHTPAESRASSLLHSIFNCDTAASEGKGPKAEKRQK
jgi:hypothetical protein